MDAHMTKPTKPACIALQTTRAPYLYSTMGLIFTVISVARGYIIRRWFNARLQRAAQRMAEAVA